MSFKVPGGGKFAQLMAHHVLGDVHRDELVSIVHGHSVPYKVRSYHRPSTPGFYHLLLAAIVYPLYFANKLVRNIRPFL